jgi:hypothetical protein
VKEERNILSTRKRGKANRIGHTLRRNCLVKHVSEGKIEGRIKVTRGQGRRRKQLLDNLKETRRYRKLKEEALDRTLWRTCFGRGCGLVIRWTAVSEWMTNIRSIMTELRCRSTAHVKRESEDIINNDVT